MRRLLFIAAAFIVMTASAQMKTVYHEVNAKEKQTQFKQHAPAYQLDLSKVTTTIEMNMGDFSSPGSVSKASQKTGKLNPWYRRPAGMYFSPLVAVDGKGFCSYGNDAFLMGKPYAEFTWEGFIDGADENTHCFWDYWDWGEYSGVDDEMSIKLAVDTGVVDVPTICAVDGDLDDPAATWYYYQMKCFDNPVKILGYVESEQYEEGVDFMYSSKTMLNGGHYGNLEGQFARYHGADPWGDNQHGWWFGKNASKVDGMAMAFEKPEHPYLLKKVYLQAYIDMVVLAPVKMTCKIYKLDEIPDYIRDNATSVTLPAEPGTLVCTGEATVTPTTAEDKNGLIEFTLYGCDEDDPSLVFEYNPTIDYPIMVCVEGYNDEGMENLVDFSAFCSIDDQTDEGYGELAYLKEGIFDVSLDENGDTILDENGNIEKHFTGEYYWRGLNNRFLARDDEDWPEKKATMMTGLTLFIGTENPFIAYKYEYWDIEYTFPAEGGQFEKTYEYDGTIITADAIVYLSSNPSEDWEVTSDGGESLPDWLHIVLSDDGADGDYYNIKVYVTADPLPDDVDYRSALVRFSIPGDYSEYKFRQGWSDGLDEQVVSTDAVPVGYYDVTGRHLSSLQQGINIVKMSDGTARKVYIK